MGRALPFLKMHGAGNDFVLVDGRIWPPAALTAPRIASLCDRRRGIGADGLIVVAPAAGVDFSMTYFNADGGEAEMCGNGARCAVAFARRLGLAGARCVFATRSGPVAGEDAGSEVRVALTPPRDLQLEVPLGADSPFPAHHYVNTGVPHLVIPVDDIAAVDLQGWGPRLRHHPRFAPAGVNVDWVGAAAADGAHPLRTYERGVEAETLACGTGAVASAVVGAGRNLVQSPVEIVTSSGMPLVVRFDLGQNGASTVTLRGQTMIVMTGMIRADALAR